MENIRFADYTVAMAEDLESLQDLMNYMNKHSEEYDIDIIVKTMPPGRLSVIEMLKIYIHVQHNRCGTTR